MLLLEAARQFDDGSRRILDCAKMSNLAAPPSLGDGTRNRVFVDVQADECVDLRHEPFPWKTSPAGSQGLHNWTASAAAKKGHCHLESATVSIGLRGSSAFRRLNAGNSSPAANKRSSPIESIGHAPTSFKPVSWTRPAVVTSRSPTAAKPC